MYSRCGRFGNLTVAKNIGPDPRATWGSPHLWLFSTSANRTRMMISPNKQSKHLARRQQQSLWGPRSSGAASYSNAAGSKVLERRDSAPKTEKMIASVMSRCLWNIFSAMCTECTTVARNFLRSHDMNCLLRTTRFSGQVSSFMQR
jgi:hypothetical protein